jgi:S1-C subfamily serine protease
MAKGQVVRSFDYADATWSYVVPRSVGESHFKIACEVTTPPRTASSLPNPSFSLVNRSSQSILVLYVSSAGIGQWGQDKLPGILRPGRKEWVDLPRDGQCAFDVQVVYADNSRETKAGQDLCALEELAFDGSRRVAAGSSAGSQPRVASASRGTSYGTGFFVSPRGHALTNNHVVESCRSIGAHLQTGRASAEVLRRDSQNDLALIQVRTSGTSRFVNFRSSPAVKIGEGVVAAGFPLSNVLQNGLNATVGNVSALAGLKGNAALLQITAPVQQGNSGGPLLDMSGNLVGVVVGKLDAARVAEVTGDIPQNVNFAVKGTVARLFLEASGQQVAETPSNAELRTGDVSEQARGFTFQIECQN